ncbi:unnamed protein product, partial [Polarella glacialis]
VAAMADVEWDMKVEDEPDLADGPVWCLTSHQDLGSSRLQLHLERSTKRLLHYTHFSDEALMLAKEARCNACGLILLTETSDGLLLLERSNTGPSLRLLPCGSTLSSASLLEAVGQALATFGPLAGGSSSAAALGSARLLAVLDVGEDTPEGHRHELVVGVRLPLTAEEVQKACKEPSSVEQALLFLRFPGVEAPAASPELPCAGELQDLLAEDGGKLPEMQRRALQLLLALRAA